MTLLRDLIVCKQFNSSVDSDLRLWLIDQRPKTLAEAARLADQFAVVRKAEHPASKGVMTENRNQLLSQVVGKSVLVSIILRRPIPQPVPP